MDEVVIFVVRPKRRDSNLVARVATMSDCHLVEIWRLEPPGPELVNVAFFEIGDEKAFEYAREKVDMDTE